MNGEGAALPLWSRVLLSFFAAGMIGAMGAGVALPLEDWPLTSAPMFAHPHVRGDPKFRFVFDVRTRKGAVRELRSLDVGLSDTRLMRLFFGHTYGSTDPDYPHGRLGPDTPERFRERQRRFFRALVGEVERRRRARGVARVELVVERVVRRKVEERRLVGAYEVAGDRFEHLWAERATVKEAP